MIKGIAFPISPFPLVTCWEIPKMLSSIYIYRQLTLADLFREHCYNIHQTLQREALSPVAGTNKPKVFP